MSFNINAYNIKDTLFTDSGKPIHKVINHYDIYLDRTTFLFGGTETGKTTIIKDILFYLKNLIPNTMVVCPTTSLGDYEDLFPAISFKTDLTKQDLIKLWKRQQDSTQIYEMVNDVDNLKLLFNHVYDRYTDNYIKELERKTANVITNIKAEVRDFAQQKKIIDDINEKKDKRIIIAYKNTIRKQLNTLKTLENNKQLSDMDKIIINYLDFNPRIILVIDDCSEKFSKWMKYFKKTEENVFEKIGYRGRHNFITFIVVAHDDTLIPPPLRKNCLISFYTSSQAVMSSFGKSSMGYTKNECKRAIECANKIFPFEEGEEKSKSYEKFAYIKKSSSPFRYHIAKIRPGFKMGSQCLWDLSAKLPKKTHDISNNSLLNNILNNKKEKKKKGTYMKRKSKRVYK